MNRVLEDHLALDLAKLGTLEQGVRRRLPALHASDWEWEPWCSGGYVLGLVDRWASATIRRDGDTLHVNVSASSDTRTVDRSAHEIRLAEAPNAVGGTRLWLCCPGCERQVRAVYFRHGRFGCRVCADLKHRSTVTFKPQRLGKRAADIKRLLTRTGRLERPWYMRRKRFLALLDEYRRLHPSIPAPRPLRKLPPTAWSAVRLDR